MKNSPPPRPLSKNLQRGKRKTFVSLTKVLFFSYWQRLKTGAALPSARTVYRTEWINIRTEDLLIKVLHASFLIFR